MLVQGRNFVESTRDWMQTGPSMRVVRSDISKVSGC